MPLFFVAYFIESSGGERERERERESRGRKNAKVSSFLFITRVYVMPSASVPNFSYFNDK
jgi:hypothetical protein